MEIRTGAQTTYQIGYHMVWGVKYHKYLLNDKIKSFLVQKLKDVCESYDYYFYCTGIAPNHVHFFVGAPPEVAPAVIARTVKSITAKEIFKNFPEVKKQLWGGEFWKNGYYVGTIGEVQTEALVRKYLEKQGEEISSMKQLKLFY
jgi:putative transposase